MVSSTRIFVTFCWQDSGDWREAYDANRMNEAVRISGVMLSGGVYVEWDGGQLSGD